MKPDTITLTFKLQDGDFDLGLGETDGLLPPFNYCFYFNKVTNSFVTDTTGIGLNDLITYKDRKTIDTLPDLTVPRWMQVRSDDPQPITVDTVYFLRNPNVFNLTCELLVYDDAKLIWEKYSSYVHCTFPNYCDDFLKGTFPKLDGYSRVVQPPFAYQHISFKEGIMTYSTFKFGLYSRLSDKKIKLSFYIKDRALHHSNVVETSEILIQ